MNHPIRIVIAGLAGGLFVFLVAAAGWVGGQHMANGQHVQSRKQLSQSLLETRGLLGAQSTQIDYIFKRLDALDKAQPKTNDKTIDDHIQAAVKKAMAKSGVDKDSLSDRVRAIIREIAKQSAAEQGQAKHKTARAPTRRDAGAIGQPVSDVTPVDAESDHILGDPDAPFSVIVFDDFECPFCQRHHPTIKKIAKHFDGQVNVVFRQMPLGMHGQAAKREAMISECVAQQGGSEAFWDYADGVFKHTVGDGRGLTDTAMDSVLSSAGLKPQSVYDCVDNNRKALMGKINKDIAEGQRLGIMGTPGNVLLDNDSGEALRINGARPMAQFVPAINAFIKTQ